MNQHPFSVGQKVVCVFSHFPAAVYAEFKRTPEESHTYTISSVFWGREHITGRRMPSIRLSELPPLPGGSAGFSAWRFRLVTNKRKLRQLARKQQPGILTPAALPKLSACHDIHPRMLPWQISHPTV